MQEIDIIMVLLLIMFASPTAWLLVWGVRNGKLADWKESLLKLRETIYRVFSRYLNKVIHEEELRRRSTIIHTLKRVSKERRSTSKGTKVLI